MLMGLDEYLAVATQGSVDRPAPFYREAVGLPCPIRAIGVIRGLSTYQNASLDPGLQPSRPLRIKHPDHEDHFLGDDPRGLALQRIVRTCFTDPKQTMRLVRRCATGVIPAEFPWLGPIRQRDELALHNYQ